MILVDTSIWIDHFRRADAALATALTAGQVGLHPFVIGELTLGTVPQRVTTLALLATLPCLVPSAHADVVAFAERNRLVGAGIGWVDVHLLCAARAARWDSLDARLPPPRRRHTAVARRRMRQRSWLPSRVRSPWGSKPRTKPASSIATSSPPTSRCGPTAQ